MSTPDGAGTRTRQRRRGISLAFGAAAVSGVAVFVNSYGVRAVGDATVYTTAKNLVAAGLLVGLISVTSVPRWRASRNRPAGWAPIRPGRLIALAAIGVVGGSVPFVLFFEGLARASSTEAAFVHKTLVLWVAALAVPLLGERLRAVHVVALAALLVGQAILSGRPADLRFGEGESMVLAATLMWSVEVVLVKRLLRDVTPNMVAVARMAAGAAVLMVWVAATGRWSMLAGLDRAGWAWALVTGAILAGYVSLWFTALSLAPAIDVTAVLVLAAAVTGLLEVVAEGTPVTASNAIGMVIVLGGVGLVAAAGRSARRRALSQEPAAS